MTADSPDNATPKRKRRWLRLILLAMFVIAAVECVAILCQAGNRLPVEMAIGWTTASTWGFVSAARRVKRENPAAMLHAQKQKLWRLRDVGMAAVLLFWLFGWAILGGIAWGVVPGLLLLYAEFVAALVTALVVALAHDWLERRFARRCPQ